MGTVQITHGQIRIDDQSAAIHAGVLHYFRLCPEHWADRIAKARMMGLNTIETYVPHNLHEPKPGHFDFSGRLDLARFLREVQAAGLHAIVRPGPYICAEWENGGLPSWLTADRTMDIRCSDEKFLAVTDRYLAACFEQIRSLQYTQGGPIILMQIENEYGSYGKDQLYLERMRRMFLDGGIDIPLLTSDGPSDPMLQGGTLPDCLQTLNFGSQSAQAFAKGRSYRPEGPDFCMEFWLGWFDHWGKAHHTRSAESVAVELDAMLAVGAHVNCFVFCGGTNFGFMNGANGLGEKPDDYWPTVTSYDYDGLLTECGDPTPKFFACQEVFRRYFPDRPYGTPLASVKRAYGQVPLTESASLLDQLDLLAPRRQFLTPPTMEASGQSYGFIHYRTQIRGPLDGHLYLPQVRDRALAYLDGVYLGAIYRKDAERKLPLRVAPGGGRLDLLVENLGRINYGPLLGRDHKGLPGGVCAGVWQMQSDFDVWNLELSSLDGLCFEPAWRIADQVPTFYRGHFDVTDPQDTFLEFPGEKGVVWINGFNIGRYWDIGPGNTLYVPGPLLKTGRNEIIVLELHRLQASFITLVDAPNVG